MGENRERLREMNGNEGSNCLEMAAYSLISSSVAHLSPRFLEDSSSKDAAISSLREANFQMQAPSTLIALKLDVFERFRLVCWRFQLFSAAFLLIS